MRFSLILRNKYQVLSAHSLASLAACNWTVQNSKLCKQFKLSSHTNAGKFCSEVAISADNARHHPEMLIKYRNVDVTLFTNDVGAITTSDKNLAETIDSIYNQIKINK